MNKLFLIFTLTTAVSLSNALHSMDKPISDSQEFLWTTLPIELQQIILSYVGLDRAQSFSQVLDKLKCLEKSPLFNNMVNNKAFIAGLAKIYIETHKDKTRIEFFNAALENQKAVIQAFIDAGIDVNAKCRDNRTALMGASFNGFPEVVQMLLNANADVNARDDDGYTALLDTITGGKLIHYRLDTKIVEMLLAAGANANATDIHGRTALMQAVIIRHERIVEMLIANGADVNARDREGNTALSLTHWPKIVAMLKAAGAKE